MRDTKRFGVYIDVLIQYREIWENALLGLELTRAYCESYTVTADSVAASLRISDDTARRLLDRLVSRGRVLMVIQQGRRRYAPVAEFAERSLAIISEAEKYHPQTAVDGHASAANCGLT